MKTHGVYLLMRMCHFLAWSSDRGEGSGLVNDLIRAFFFFPVLRVFENFNPLISIRANVAADPPLSDDRHQEA